MKDGKTAAVELTFCETAESYVFFSMLSLGGGLGVGNQDGLGLGVLDLLVLLNLRDCKFPSAFRLVDMTK